MTAPLFSRRQLLISGAALPFALRALAEPAATPRWVFLGTDQGKGIYRARWNAATGELGPVELAIATPRPDFFAKYPKLPVLYSVNSVGDGKGAVSSFRIDAAHGGLTHLNTVSSHGDGPCAVSVDATGTMAFVANYGGGSFAAYALQPDGTLGRTVDTLMCQGNPACGTTGPVKDRQDAAHIHCVTLSPDNQHVVVCDLGDDSIEVFPIHPGSKPSVGPAQRVAARAGSGPRHVAFHPNGRWLYCIHELDSTIDLYDWHPEPGKPPMTLRPGSTISTITPAQKPKPHTACEIVISPDGRFAYACTRFTDEITTYRIDPQTGLLTELQRLSCGGQVPRYIAFDPTHRWLVSCNQAPPGNVAVFAHDPATGHIDPKPKTFRANTPMFIEWL